MIECRVQSRGFFCEKFARVVQKKVCIEGAEYDFGGSHRIVDGGSMDRATSTVGSAGCFHNEQVDS